MPRHVMNSGAGQLDRVGEQQANSDVQSVLSKVDQRLLSEWNATSVDYPLEGCLYEHFEAQVSRTPDAVAVVFEGARLTYLELDRKANQLARYLRSLGVRPNDLVAICMERSLDLVVALLGTLKSGGAYVPVDPDYPKERVDFMLEDLGGLVLSQSKIAKALGLEGSVNRTICLDTDWGTIGTFVDTTLERVDFDLQRVNTSNDLAYVIYTSGSTGKPKGALNSHRGICNRLLWMQDTYCLTESDTVLQKTPFSFDVSVWEFFWPLMAGARMVLAKPGGHRDGRYLVELIKRERVSVLHFVPSMLRLFLEEPDLRACTSLRDVICSGEALSLELQDRFFKRLDARLHNLYGPTEAAIDVTFWACQQGENRLSIPIGKPVANTRIYILDSNMEPVPIGQEGELYIGGVQVGLGYLNRPDLTEKSFLSDPFVSDPNARLYKTGDLARYLPDGNIEFLGRIDHQVKIRGYRIELGEIEHVAQTHPDVKQCIVLAREDGPEDRRLVAYILPSHEESPSFGQLRHYLEARLPEYMVPSTFIPITTVPLNPSGKVDRKVLPAPNQARPELDQAYVAPQGELEAYLTSIWSDVLGLEKVGARDPFFELGGDSLKAMRFINNLQKYLGEFIYIVTIFENPTISQYAAFLRRDYASAVNDKFSEEVSSSCSENEKKSPDAPKRINADDVEKMRKAIPALDRSAASIDSSLKNCRALFILAPPRSGTTLLRAMLAGHPKLFSAPELQLLGFNTLAERKEAFCGKNAHWLEGAVRAIMQLKGCDADEAKRLMAEQEDRNLSTKAFYGVLQGWLGGRMLVDKTPAYASDFGALMKAESDFEEPIYIHLTRHPYSMVRSFESYHMDQVLYLRDHPYSPRQLGELIWTISHQNILQFFSKVPPNRRYRICFEQLVAEPERVMREMCRHLSIEFNEGLIKPYIDTDKKMTDGLYKDSTPMGDTRFLEHKRFRPEIGDKWKGVIEDDFLGTVTWQTATRLGYERPQSGRKARQRPRSRRRRLSGSRERV